MNKTEEELYSSNDTKREREGGEAANPPPAQKQNDQKHEEKKVYVKNIYGEYNNVKLTEEEYNNLNDMHGEEELKKHIEELSGYMESKGVKYNNHAVTLERWIKRSADEKAAKEKQAAAKAATEKPKPKNRFANFKQRKYSEEDIERMNKLERAYLRQKYDKKTPEDSES